jgi:hypothetical protein
MSMMCSGGCSFLMFEKQNLHRMFATLFVSPRPRPSPRDPPTATRDPPKPTVGGGPCLFVQCAPPRPESRRRRRACSLQPPARGEHKRHNLAPCSKRRPTGMKPTNPPGTACLRPLPSPPSHHDASGSAVLVAGAAGPLGPAPGLGQGENGSPGERGQRSIGLRRSPGTAACCSRHPPSSLAARPGGSGPGRQGLRGQGRQWRLRGRRADGHGGAVGHHQVPGRAEGRAQLQQKLGWACAGSLPPVRLARSLGGAGAPGPPASGAMLPMGWGCRLG